MVEFDGEDIIVRERKVAPPSTVSDEARATLVTQPLLTTILFADPEPSPDDHESWRRYITKREEAGAALLSAAMPERHPNVLSTHSLDGQTLYEIRPERRSDMYDNRVALYLHGGGYTSGRGVNSAYLAMPFADELGMTTFSPDYRLPPEFPFPAAVDDALAAYEFLLRSWKPQSIMVAGRSAGAGLAAAFLLKARDNGLAMPAACALQTPEADLTESGDSFSFNNGVDNLLRPLPNASALYADGHDLRDPYISPLFGDFRAGFPPTILTSGTRDLFLSNTVLMHRALRRAGITADLHIWEAMGHGGFFEMAPEDEEVWKELRLFAQYHLSS